MKRTRPYSRISRRALLSTAAVLPSLPGLIAATAADAQAPAGVLPSWNDGPAKQAILDFVHATIDQASPSYVPADDRVATFDQDGTLWVEHPIYTQAMFALDRVRVLASAHPEWKNDEPFKTVLSGDLEAVGHFTERRTGPKSSAPPTPGSAPTSSWTLPSNGWKRQSIRASSGSTPSSSISRCSRSWTICAPASSTPTS